MSTPISRLSVLDLVPVRQGRTSGEAIAASRSLAQAADRLGYERYWVAEHHNMPAIASTNPPVIMAMLAAATERIRVGSGGVMLPNHAPLVVAEQFALLEAAFPGRIDLGIGRAPGTDPVTSWALRHGGGGVTDDAVQRFPEYVDHVLALMHPDGAAVQVSGGAHALKATPAAQGVAGVWLLGSSDYSARLAAEKGLPYVFAHHFAGQGTAEALELYRRGWAQAGHPGEPTTFLTVNVCAAETEEEARRLALPQGLSMLALRTGMPLRPSATVEQAEAEVAALPPAHADLIEAMMRRWTIGTPEQVAERLGALAADHGVDEVMVHPIAGAYDADPADRVPARERTLELVAQAVGSAVAVG